MLKHWRQPRLDYLILFVVVLVVGVRYSIVAMNRFIVRSPIDLVEGIVLQQSNTVPNWSALYPTPEAQPALLTAYSPLFYILHQIFFGDQSTFLFGRLISTASLAVIALVLIAIGKNNAARIFALLALLFSSTVMMYWSLLNRVDMLAVALSMVAILVFKKSKRLQIPGAALFLSLAFFTKQSVGAAALFYILSWLFLRKRYRSLGLLIFLMVLILGLPSLWLNQVTGGGFYFNLVTANIGMNWSFDQFHYYVSEFFVRHMVLLFGLGLLVLHEPEALKRKREIWIFLLVALLTSLTVAKVGSNSNYFLESIVGLIWLTTELFSESKKRFELVWLVIFTILIDLAVVRFNGINYMEKLDTSDNYSIIKDDVKKSHLVLADELSMAELPTRSKPIVIDPFATKELIVTGKIKQKPLSEFIQAQVPDLILITDITGYCCSKDFGWGELGAANGWLFWTEQSYEDIWRNYRLEKKVGNVLFFRPKPESN